MNELVATLISAADTLSDAYFENPEVAKRMSAAINEITRVAEELKSRDAAIQPELLDTSSTANQLCAICGAEKTNIYALCSDHARYGSAELGTINENNPPLSGREIPEPETIEAGHETEVEQILASMPELDDQ